MASTPNLDGADAEMDNFPEKKTVSEPTKEAKTEQHDAPAKELNEQAPRATFADPTKVRDRQVYHTYFGSIGVRRLAIFQGSLLRNHFRFYAEVPG